MGGAGFEPAKAEPTDLQSVPFDRFGNPPEGEPNNRLKPLSRNSLAKQKRASGGSRTHDLLITNQLLCQLSYAGQTRKERKYIEFS